MSRAGGGRPARGSRLRPAAARVPLLLAGVLLALTTGGCAAVGTAPAEPVGVRPLDGSSAGTAASTGAAADDAAPAARDGRSGPTVRLRFVPQRVTLDDGTHAAVEPAATVDGVLAVPTDVRRVGWWDGSAEAGDPFGATVIAGHVDSRTQGLGYFARLRSVRRGDVVTVSGVPDGGRGVRSLRYRVHSIRDVDKGALSADSAAFGQDGDHRLVLITCAGAYDPARGGYQDNLVIVADPVG